MGFSKKYHNDMMKRAKLKQDQCNKHEWITIMGDKICKKCGIAKIDANKDFFDGF